MKKILISLIALFGLALIQIPTDSALAAPSIRIFKAATGEEGVSSFTIPQNDESSTHQVYIALSEAPTNSVNLTITHTGAAVIYWTGSENLTFNILNWNQRRPVTFYYQGTGQPGAKGKITLTGNGVGSREILFSVAGTSTGGTNSGGTTNNTGTTSGNLTQIAENITEDDLKGLGFADITLNKLVDRVIMLLLILIALGGFFSIMYSGYQYITSNGDAAITAKARKNIVWALIGIIIALFAFAAVRFVAGLGEKGSLSQPTGTTSTSTTPITGSTGSTNGTSILITDSNQFSPSTIIIDDLTKQESHLFNVVLSAESGDTEVTITKTGNLPITVTPQQFTFNDKNWQTPQQLGISYNGDGKSGEAAEVILKTSSGARYVIRVEAL